MRRDASLPATKVSGLTFPLEWSHAQPLGRCPKPHKGRCPLTLQGADEKGRPGYGLYDRALGATYLNGLWEAICRMKGEKK